MRSTPSSHKEDSPYAVHTLSNPSCVRVAGLGKTVQSLAGAVIRNAKREHPTRTVIVSPGEGVQNQWHTTLVDIGVCESQIEIVGEAKKETTRRRGTKGSSSVKGTFILLRRHQIMSQVRGIAQCASKSARRKALKESLLFSRLPIDLIDDLHNEYLVEHPKHKEDVEGNYLNIGARSSDYEGTAPDRMVSLMRDSFPEDRRYSRQFDMVIMGKPLPKLIIQKTRRQLSRPVFSYRRKPLPQERVYVRWHWCNFVDSAIATKCHVDWHAIPGTELLVRSKHAQLNFNLTMGTCSAFQRITREICRYERLLIANCANFNQILIISSHSIGANDLY